MSFRIAVAIATSFFISTNISFSQGNPQQGQPANPGTTKLLPPGRRAHLPHPSTGATWITHAPTTKTWGYEPCLVLGTTTPVDVAPIDSQLLPQQRHGATSVFSALSPKPTSLLRLTTNLLLNTALLWESQLVSEQDRRL